MHPIDARAENSGIDENCPSRITRSTFAGHAKVATLDSESSATTANGHPAFAHSWVSLSAVKPELLRSLGHPCTNQQISAPGTPRRSRLANVHARKGRTLARIKTLAVLI